MSQQTVQITCEILDERQRQDAKWGEQNHTPAEWYAVLGEEFGEVGKAILEARFGGKSLADYRTECLQVAAVACAMVECLDRNAAETDPFGRYK